MKTFRTCLIAIALSLSAIAPAWGQIYQRQTYQNDLDAMFPGNYAEVLRIWGSLAQRDDARGKAALVFWTLMGYGVPKNDTEALRLFSPLRTETILMGSII